MTLIDIGRFITVLIIALIILVLIIVLIMMKIMASGMMVMRREDSDTAVPPSNIGPSWAIPPHLVVTNEIIIIIMVFLLNMLVLIITTFCVKLKVLILNFSSVVKNLSYIISSLYIDAHFWQCTPRTFL